VKPYETRMAVRLLYAPSERGDFYLDLCGYRTKLINDEQPLHESDTKQLFRGIYLACPINATEPERGQDPFLA
jgi:hypothetical protein